MKDMSVVPPNFYQFVKTLIKFLDAGNKVLVYCMGGHGRTGSILAALIALLEPGVRDVVDEVRKRYCEHAVESNGQKEALDYVRVRTQANPRHNRADV